MQNNIIPFTKKIQGPSLPGIRQGKGLPKLIGVHLHLSTFSLS
jgi:hypothetical protein